MVVDQPNLEKCTRIFACTHFMLMLSDSTLYATLTFYPEGHLQGHKVCIIFDIIWPAITGQNAQQRRPTLLHNG